MGSLCSVNADKVQAPKRPPSRSKDAQKQSTSSSKGPASPGLKPKVTSTKDAEELLCKTTSLNEFDVMNTIGTGSFGAVKLARHKQSDRMVAIKMTHKNHAKKQVPGAPGPVESLAWKQLMQCKSHFVVRMYTTFCSSTDVCVIMELVEGGDLHVHLELRGNFSSSDSRFYIVEISLGLGALHALGVVYHDLKPQNMILSKDGHIKLIDFGLATVKERGVRRSCMCMSGAPSYMAPEVFEGTGHDEMIDWWAMGITYFEFLSGYRPFGGGTVADIGREVKTCEPDWPSDFGKEEKSCIKELLAKDPADRLGYRGGLDAVKRHGNFASIKWDKMKDAKGKGPGRDVKGASMKGTGGAALSRMDACMMSARGGGKKGERRFTITDPSSKTKTSTGPDPTMKDTIGGKDRESKFADARSRATKRKSC